MLEGKKSSNGQSVAHRVACNSMTSLHVGGRSRSRIGRTCLEKKGWNGEIHSYKDKNTKMCLYGKVAAAS